MASLDVLEFLDAELLVGRVRGGSPLAAGASRIDPERDETFGGQGLVEQAACRASRRSPSACGGRRRS